METPVLSNACGTDPQLDYFEIESPHRFMMTSPEFHMKRLLAADFGDIFQITKSFRKDEFGAHHNNEFSMVEWYRVGMPQEKLMDEVEALVSEILGKPLKARRTRWIDDSLVIKNYSGSTKGITFKNMQVWTRFLLLPKNSSQPVNPKTFRSLPTRLICPERTGGTT